MYCYLKRAKGCGCSCKSVHNRFCHSCLLWWGSCSLNIATCSIMCRKWRLRTRLFCCRGGTLHCTSNWYLEPSWDFRTVFVLSATTCVTSGPRLLRYIDKYQLWWGVQFPLLRSHVSFVLLGSRASLQQQPYRPIPDHWLIKKETLQTLTVTT